MLKKMNLFLCIMVVMVGVLVTGCQKSEDTSTMDKIKSSKKLVVGTSADYPPYEFHTQVDGKDKIVGFDMALAQEIASDMGVELEIKDMKFDALLVALNSGTVDMLISGMTPSAERAKNVDFSNVYHDASQALVVKSGSDINSMSDLEGKNIAVQRGSIQEEIANTQIPGANVKSLVKVPDIVLELNTGKVDGIILEDVVAKSYVDENDDLQIANVKFDNKDQGTAVAMKKGDTELVDSVNKTIDRLKKENKIDKFVVDAVKSINE